VKIRIQSTKLGRSELVDPEALITFQDGILGFPDIKTYLLIKDDQEHPFLWLQSEKDPDLAFFVVDPLILKPDYHPDFSPIDLRSLDLLSTEGKMLDSMTLLSIITVPENDPTQLSANLMAPLLINHRLRKGKQVVLNDSCYAIREPIMTSLG